MPNFTALPEVRAGTSATAFSGYAPGDVQGSAARLSAGHALLVQQFGICPSRGDHRTVTQQPFAEALREYILVPIGARDTHYDSFERILPRRARGYEPEGAATGMRRISTCRSRTPPARSCLDGGRPAHWDTALSSGRILKPESLAKMMAPFRLSDGARRTMAMAGGCADFGGHAVAEQSGGINGFRCHVVRIADANAYVAVLSNDGTARPPRVTARTEDRVAARRRAARRNRPRPRCRRRYSTSSRAAISFPTTAGSPSPATATPCGWTAPAATPCSTPYAAINSRNAAASRSTPSSVMRRVRSTASNSPAGANPSAETRTR